jgi:hypothetical protein
LNQRLIQIIEPGYLLNSGDSLVPIDDPRGIAMQAEASDKYAKQLEAKKERIDEEIKEEAKDRNVTITREMALMRSKVQDSLQVQLSDADRKILNPLNYTLADVSDEGVKAVKQQGIDAVKKAGADMIKVNAEMNILANGIQALRANGIPEQAFADSINRLEADAAKWISVYTDPNQPEYKTVRLRVAGLAEIRRKLESY